MANKEHLHIIKQSVDAWNDWKHENPRIVPNFHGANLSSLDLSGANLSEANLSEANLKETNLRFSILSGANLIKADLSAGSLAYANLFGARLYKANLREVNLISANLSSADLSDAILCEALLKSVNFTEAALSGTDFSQARVGWTQFGSTDLSSVKGLETLTHAGPSTIGVDTLYLSQGHIPDAFLRGAGVPEEFIIQLPAIVASLKPIQFYSCFISYNHQDEKFSQRLYSRMRRENLRVWYAPEDIRGGRKLHDEIFSAIQIHDKLLLVLSENSMKSEWVMSEIRRARKVEREENRRKLFPIRLVGFDAIRKWECFDADSGNDLAAELREYYMPDFSNWKDYDAFEKEFAKLLRDLKSAES